jgi:hypothetical protein
VYPPPQKKLSQPLYTLPPKIWQKPHGPSFRIFKPCASMSRNDLSEYIYRLVFYSHLCALLQIRIERETCFFQFSLFRYEHTIGGRNKNSMQNMFLKSLTGFIIFLIFFNFGKCLDVPEVDQTSIASVVYDGGVFKVIFI